MSDAENKSKGALDRLYEFFCSIKLTLFILIALAVTSIIGTVIQQGREPALYVQEYGAGAAQLIQFLSLQDMYHSWWFQVLLALLLANITLCSVRRLPQALRLMRDANPVFEGRPVAMHEKWEYAAKGLTPEAAADRAEKLLAEGLGRPLRAERDGNVYLFVSKGGWARMGVYITHFSLFLFAVGALVGSYWGFKGFAQIPEGQSIKEVALRDGGTLPLGFEIRLDKFTLSYYNDATGAPTDRVKAYLSDLTVLDGGREVQRKQIAVNSPLIYKGIYFYQSSYGQTPSGGATVSVFGANHNVIAHRAPLRKGGPGIDLGDGNILELLDLTSDLRGAGPAVLLRVRTKEGQPLGEPSVAIASRGPSPVGNYLVALAGVDSVMYTGLQVAKDPGVPVIWAGCILISLGLIIAFFGSHRRVWLRVSPSAGGASIFLAGNASRNRIAFENRFHELCENAEQAFKA